MQASHYETVTKPALRRLERTTTVAHGGRHASMTMVKAAVDAAAAAGATPNEIADAVGGRDSWNLLVRALREAGLVSS